MPNFYLFSLLIVIWQVIFSQSAPEPGWKQFVSKHERVFKSQEDEAKKPSIFNENMMIINELNAQNLGHTVGVNRFADMPLEDARRRYTGLG
jgi:hypothetical protein